MSYLALYRKYRPEDFKSLVGQDPIVRTLKNGLKEGKVSHAYLFSGVRGTGKTSTAKILAKAVNCLNLRDGEPCNECENCKKINEGIFMDLIEIDAASNRGIDEIRDLREKIKYLPVEGKMKVYIIDEVHMLTGEAFNALLKTLEEPPGHVIFILATTEPQKIPLTILSRCQKFEFQKIPNDILKERLQFIIDERGGKITEEGLSLITKLSGGGLRDAISLLDQALVASSGEVTGAVLAELAGIVPDEDIISLFTGIGEKNLDRVIKEYEVLKEKGKSTSQLISDLMEGFKDMLLIKTLKSPKEYTIVSEELFNSYKELSGLYTKEGILQWVYALGILESSLKFSTHPDILLEVTLIKEIGNDGGVKEVVAEKSAVKKEIDEEPVEALPPMEEVIEIIEETPPVMAEETIEEVPEVVEKIVVEVDAPTESEEAIPEETPNEEDGEGEQVFLEFLKALKKENVLVYPFYVEGKCIGLEGKTLILSYPKKYKFHQERAMSEKNKGAAEEIIKNQTGKRYHFKFVLEKEEGEKEKSPEEKIKDVFGDDVTFID